MSFVKRFERRALLSGPATAWATDVEASAGPTNSGVAVGPAEARTLTAVWSCQSLIADSICSLPIDTYRQTRKGGLKTALPNPKWIDKPNAFETRYSFWHKVLISLLGQDGNAFIMFGRDGSGNIVAAVALDPSQVTIDEKSSTPRFLVGGIEYTDYEILHIPAFTIPGLRRGLSVIDNARESIGLGLAAEEFGARFFSQGTTMAGVIEHPGSPKPGEVAIMARMLRKKHAGLVNSHALGILTGGATWKPVSITPEQAQFLETRRFQNIQIAQLYRVPPHLIDPSVTSSWGTGIEEQNKFFADYTLVPWLVRIEQAVSAILPGGQTIKFNVDARLRAKTAERFAAYTAAIGSGVMNPDEARALEDLPPIPDGHGEAFYIPSGLTELGADPPPPPEPPTPPDPQGDKPPEDNTTTTETDTGTNDAGN